MAVIRQGNAEGGNGRPFDLRQQKSLRLQAPSARKRRRRQRASIRKLQGRMPAALIANAFRGFLFACFDRWPVGFAAVLRAPAEKVRMCVRPPDVAVRGDAVEHQMTDFRSGEKLAYQRPSMRRFVGSAKQLPILRHAVSSPYLSK